MTKFEDYSIDDVFEELKRIGQCTSRSRFSTYWLSRNESYFRSIQSKGIRASVEAELNLAARLRELGHSFAREDDPTIARIGMSYLDMYGKCLDALLTRAHLDALKWTANA
jgi:hypothetical protein